MIDQPMTLYFNDFETAILFTTILVFNVHLTRFLANVSS
jgi:hypothetical protein